MSATSTSAKPVVMVVDDDWMNRELMQNFLERAGFRALHANGGAVALELAERDQPAVIVCDVRMAGMSGYEVCQRLKANPATSHIPVIILSAYEKETERAKAMAAGAADFISKIGGWLPVIERIRALVNS